MDTVLILLLYVGKLKDAFDVASIVYGTCVRGLFAKFLREG